MFVKCSCADCVDNALINLPENDYYEFRSKSDDGIYLIFLNKEIQLRDIEHWCQGRPELPCCEVENLYDELVNVIANMLANDENIKVLDFDKIESDLITEKYEKRWLSKGYVTVKDEWGGRW